MSFEDEWAKLGEDAAQKSTSMELNRLDGGSAGAPTDGGGGNGDLVVHSDQLGQLGDMSRDLYEQLKVDADHARKTTFDASVQLFTDGLDMGSAMTELHDAWNSQVATLKEACAHISNHLDYTRSAHAEDEEKIATGMKNIDGDLMTVSRIYDYLK